MQTQSQPTDPSRPRSSCPDNFIDILLNKELPPPIVTPKGWEAVEQKTAQLREDKSPLSQFLERVAGGDTKARIELVSETLQGLTKYNDANIVANLLARA